jgi:hypothetical protein
LTDGTQRRAADLANAFGNIVGGREDLVALLIDAPAS